MQYKKQEIYFQIVVNNINKWLFFPFMSYISYNTTAISAYTKQSVENGIIIETFNPKNPTRHLATDRCIVFFTGIGILPHTQDPTTLEYETQRTAHYTGAFASLLADAAQTPVHIVYQAAVSGNENKRGMYSDETNLAQLVAAQKIAGHKKVYPIYHSLSSVAGIELALQGSYSGKEFPTFCGGVISSVLTTAEDALDYGIIPWHTVFKIAQHFSLPWPYNPTAPQWLHDGEEKIPAHPALRPEFFVNTACARAILRYNTKKTVEDYLKKNKTPLHQPLFIVTKQDQLFDPEKQKEIAQLFNREPLLIDAGHRWFTSNVVQHVIEEIVKNYKQCHI